MLSIDDYGTFGWYGHFDCANKTKEMPRKRKKAKFSVVKAVKANARERLGSPRPTQRQQNPKKSKSDKHRPTLGTLLSDQ